MENNEEELEENVDSQDDSTNAFSLEGFTGEEIRSPGKAIRAKCLECSQGNTEVTTCVVKDCPLYPFRMGHNPYRTPRTLSDEERLRMSEMGKKMGERRKKPIIPTKPLRV